MNGKPTNSYWDSYFNHKKYISDTLCSVLCWIRAGISIKIETDKFARFFYRRDNNQESIGLGYT